MTVQRSRSIRRRKGSMASSAVSMPFLRSSNPSVEAWRNSSGWCDPSARTWVEPRPKQALHVAGARRRARHASTSTSTSQVSFPSPSEHVGHEPSSRRVTSGAPRTTVVDSFPYNGVRSLGDDLNVDIARPRSSQFDRRRWRRDWRCWSRSGACWRGSAAASGNCLTARAWWEGKTAKRRRRKKQ